MGCLSDGSGIGANVCVLLKSRGANVKAISPIVNGKSMFFVFL